MIFLVEFRFVTLLKKHRLLAELTWYFLKSTTTKIVIFPGYMSTFIFVNADMKFSFDERLMKYIVKQVYLDFGRVLSLLLLWSAS